MITNMFITFLNMTISATIGGILLIAWRQITQKYIPYKYYYILWGVLFLRFAVPVSFTSVFSLLSLVNVPRQQQSSGGGYMVTMEYVDVDKLATITENYGSNVLNIVSAVWFTVAVVLILRWFVLYFRTKKKLEYAVLFKHPVVQTVAKKVNVKGKFRVYSSSLVLSPVVVGFVNPKIVLPQKAEVNRCELECILAHELIHIRRRDRYIKAVIWFIASMHWYNPVVWLCFYLFSRDIELSCDRELLKIFGQDYKKHYASALVTFAGRNYILKAGYTAFAQNKVMDRVNKILLHKELSFMKAVAFYVVTVFIGLSVTANPVLRESYMYIPETKPVGISVHNEIKKFATDVAGDISKGNMDNLLKKATADRDFFAPVYRNIHDSGTPVKVDRIFHTSKDSAVIYFTVEGNSAIFPKGTKHAVMEIENSRVMGEFYAENLRSYTKYESVKTVDNSNEAVMLRHKMIKYGLNSGENTAENSRKITMFCMDIAFERQNSKNTVLSARAVEDIAEEFFLITDYSNMRNTQFYNKEEKRYHFDTSVGTKYEYRIISLETERDGRQVIAEFYKDPLQLQTEKIIKYTFRKVK